MTTINSQPQAASKLPPLGYEMLEPEAFREPGDMTYTVGGWIVCHVSTGQHPPTGLYCRLIRTKNGNIRDHSVPKLGEKQHAPVQTAKTAPWLRSCTPLFFIVCNPFKDEDEIEIFQLSELRRAIKSVRDTDNAYCNLYVAYYDNVEGIFDRHMIMWVEYEDDDDTKQKRRVVKDPFEIYCPAL